MAESVAAVSLDELARCAGPTSGSAAVVSVVVAWAAHADRLPRAFFALDARLPLRASSAVSAVHHEALVRLRSALSSANVLHPHAAGAALHAFLDVILLEAARADAPRGDALRAQVLTVQRIVSTLPARVRLIEAPLVDGPA